MSSIIVYCDGGCRGNGKGDNIGGWGYTLESNGHKKEGSGFARNTTNNRMELQALVEALKVIKHKKTEVIVHLDSAYVLNGITSWIHGWKRNGWITSKKQPVENKELWMALDHEASQFSNLKYVKVKGHSGEEGNERVDYLCNMEMDRGGEQVEETPIKTPSSIHTKQGRKELLKEGIKSILATIDQDCEIDESTIAFLFKDIHGYNHYLKNPHEEDEN